LGGTKLGRTNPNSISWQIQAASATSVVRPGMVRMCRVPSNQTSMASSSR
jgi:hypothetical protein